MEVAIVDTDPAEVETDLLAVALFEKGKLQEPFGDLPGAGDTRAERNSRVLLRTALVRRSSVSIVFSSKPSLFILRDVKWRLPPGMTFDSATNVSKANSSSMTVSWLMAT